MLQSFSYMLLVVGLNRAFSSGVIYCSPITATLLTKDMGMPAERVIPLPVDTPIVIDGVSVTLMDANHCPGACMMLFKVPSKTGKPQVRLPSLCLFHLWLPGNFGILFYSRDSRAYRLYICGLMLPCACVCPCQSRLWRHVCLHNRQIACHPHS